MSFLIIYFALTCESDDREKLALIYEKHKRIMYSAAYSILFDCYLAEDAVHEAFIAIARNISKLGAAESRETAAYAVRAAKTRALNILEKNKKEVFLDEESVDIAFEESEFDRVIAKSEISAIAECINRLPQKYRIVIVLRYIDDMKPSLIAQNLGLKIDTVKKRLLRGRAMLREMLEACEE